MLEPSHRDGSEDCDQSTGDRNRKSSRSACRMARWAYATTVVRPDFRESPHGGDPPFLRVEPMTSDRGIADRAVAVVPMHNEATVVAGVVTELQTAFPVVVCVDDGSTDNSAAVARAAGAGWSPTPPTWARARLSRRASGSRCRCRPREYVVTFDADGQHDVADARAMVERRGLPRPAGGAGLSLPRRVEEVPLGRRLLLSGAVRFTRHDHGADAHRRPQRTARAAP